MIQTILLILARQLRILDRQVAYKFGPHNIIVDATSSLSITEVKLQAKVAKSKTKKKYERTLEELKKKDYSKYIAEIEQRREKELRVVHQRANSREEAKNPPTPMESLGSNEYIQYEKLLVVERMPKDKAYNKIDTGLSIVTQEQFKELNEKVKELQEQYGAVGTAGFPENMELMKELRKGASLTDSMAALQLSARMEVAERTLGQLMSLLTELATRNGIDISHITGVPNLKPPSREDSQNIDEKAPRWISAEELENAMEEIRDDITKKVKNITDKTVCNADNALKIAASLEKGLSGALMMDNRMEELENQVSEYAAKINILDTGLTAQMTHYQEQVTQMQHDLETAVESMVEALANATGDPDAVAELNLQFNHLQTELDLTATKHSELQQNQNILSSALKDVLQQIELLCEIKSDREEVTDALRDKAGIGELNGLVTREEFYAIRGDFEKRVKMAYNKFDTQELQWQQAIDDLQKQLQETADMAAVIKLRDDVNEYLDMLRTRMQAIAEIVGEPRAAAVSKILFRDAACISCLSPAHMNMTEPNMIPALPAAHKTGLNAEETKTKPKQDGDHYVCYPGQPIPHPINPSKYHVCRRYCGGLHTVTSNARNKFSTGVVVCPIRNFAQEKGTDGKMYVAEDDAAKGAECAGTPCVCNVLTKLEQPKLDMQAIENEGFTPEISNLDFTPQFNSYDGSRTLWDDTDITPPCIDE